MSLDLPLSSWEIISKISRCVQSFRKMELLFEGARKSSNDFNLESDMGESDICSFKLEAMELKYFLNFKFKFKFKFKINLSIIQ